MRHRDTVAWDRCATHDVGFGRQHRLDTGFMVGKDPREDKIRSYQRDTRNIYGENDKSSRKNIRFRKAWVNRTYRRGVHEAIAPEGDPLSSDIRPILGRRLHPSPTSAARPRGHDRHLSHRRTCTR